MTILRYQRNCLPHTSYLGFFAAFSSNVLPSLFEVVRVFYSYHPSTYIDHQKEVPSFWFRQWRPGFLITGILFDVGMFGYCIYTEDIIAILLAIRIATSIFLQLSDQVWMIKHWIPFFIQKEKRRFLFLRLFFVDCFWYLCIGSTSWSSSWQEQNNIFSSMYYISVFVIILGCGVWHLIQGGIDLFVKYRFHWVRNIFALFAGSEIILGIVGLSMGDDGESSNLVTTFNYHSAFVMIYVGIECTIALLVHYFVVVFEELSWQHPNLIASPSTLFSNDATTTDVPHGLKSVGTSNKVVCDIADATDNHLNRTINDVKPSNEGDRMVEEEDGKEEEDDEASLPNGRDSRYQSHRRHALAFDGIERRSSKLRRDISKREIIMAKLTRHDLVCREMDKLFVIVYQMLLWDAIVWLAQVFFGLYLQSVNTPIPSGQKGYYCETPLENVVNMAQFVNDFVFAR